MKIEKRLRIGCRFRCLVKTIEESAFNGCENVDFVSFIGIREIHKKAFNGLTNLESLSIPSSAEYIDDDSFDGTNLTSVIFEGTEEPAFCSNYTFNDDLEYVAVPIGYKGNHGDFCGKNTTTMGECGPGCKYIYSETTKVLMITGGEMFNWEDPSEVNWTDTMTRIERVSITGTKNVGDNAFNGATSLRKVDMSGVEIIGENAFNSTYSLTSIGLPEGLKEIHSNEFVG